MSLLPKSAPAKLLKYMGPLEQKEKHINAQELQLRSAINSLSDQLEGEVDEFKQSELRQKLNGARVMLAQGKRDLEEMKRLVNKLQHSSQMDLMHYDQSRKSGGTVRDFLALAPSTLSMEEYFGEYPLFVDVLRDGLKGNNAQQLWNGVFADAEKRLRFLGMLKDTCGNTLYGRIGGTGGRIDDPKISAMVLILKSYCLNSGRGFSNIALEQQALKDEVDGFKERFKDNEKIIEFFNESIEFLKE